jgi:L-seryl-tRNA(Ser) seleniumtransferase
MTTLRAIPSVDELVRAIEGNFPGVPRAVMVEETRRAMAGLRESLRRDGGAVAEPEMLARQAIATLLSPSLRRVINATGVILHTNLGRAPLPDLPPSGGYSNLEFDLATGKRGRRDVHVAGLIERITGRPGIVVNNNAAAVYLVLNELAAGAEVIVSRGELIEIGDGFRIPDIMARSGAALKEVGTTNRTRIADYRDAISERTRLLMRVHPSNFAVTGFTSKPALDELSALAGERGIPFYEDLGSGCLLDLRRYGIDEPTPAASIAAGVNVVSFSGDKLLGGPQAGLIAGDAALVERIRRNPMFRALRVDKLISGALETTLRHALLGNLAAIPALRMIAATADEIRARAEAVCARLPGSTIVEGRSLAGGGSTPNQWLPTWLIRMEGARDERLRHSDPPVIARVEDGCTLIDLRTVFPEEEEQLLRALQS